MIKWSRILFILLITGLLFDACKPDDDNHSNPNCDDLGISAKKCSDPSPYSLTTPDNLPKVDLPLDNPLTVEGIYLGRLLFYDPILSKDSTQSCNSCHKQEFAFTDGKRFSTGITGAIGTRNSMALFNLLWHKDGFFWDGRANNLIEQVTEPVINPIEMAHDEFCDALENLRSSSFYRQKFCDAFGTDEITQERYEWAMEQFLVSIISADSKFDKVGRGEPGVAYTPLERRGGDIFVLEPPNGADCFHCHGPSLFGTSEYSNNGLNEVHTDLGLYETTGRERDKGRFKIPSLRNIELTAPYMHDGRFATLEEVVEFYSDSVHANSPNIDPLMNHTNTGFQMNLSDLDKQALVAFLKTLTDTAFINNPAYSNPFTQ